MISGFAFESVRRARLAASELVLLSLISIFLLHSQSLLLFFLFFFFLFFFPYVWLKKKKIARITLLHFGDTCYYIIGDH
jgi:hypothetical protein